MSAGFVIVSASEVLVEGRAVVVADGDYFVDLGRCEDGGVNVEVAGCEDGGWLLGGGRLFLLCGSGVVKCVYG